ncbi:MAG: MMPL family transporter [Nocardioidaceae bacterium]
MVRAVIDVITNHRMKYVVLLFWLVVVAVSAPLAGKLTDAQQNDARTWLPGSAESTQALDRQAAFASPDTIPAVIVYERPSGLTPADLAKIKADAGAYAQIPSLDGAVVGPVPSDDGQAAQILVPLNLGPDGWSKAADVVADMTETATAGANGVNAYVTGPAGFAADSAEAFEGIDSTLLLGTIAVVVVILLFTYRSPVLWILPVISAGVALICAQAVIYLLAEYAGLVVNAQSAGILTVLVFGAGTDYALLLISRYRDELRTHEDRYAAMAAAVRGTAEAVLASSTTVVLGLLTLLLSVVPTTRGLGLACAIGVVVSATFALVVLPCALVLFGRWVFWPLVPRVGQPALVDSTRSLWRRLGDRVAARPTAYATVAVLVVAALATGLSQVQQGLSESEQFLETPESVAAADRLAASFPAGSVDPTIVLTREDHGAVLAAAKQSPGVASATAGPSDDDLARIDVVLDATAGTGRAEAAVRDLRTSLASYDETWVGGSEAEALDEADAASRDRALLVPLILGLVLAGLVLLLRSVVAPLLLVATVVGTFFAALGASWWIYSGVFGFAAMDVGVPLLAFLFLVALGVDYNIFLVTRALQESREHGVREGMLRGLTATGGVITSAGILLAAVFAVLGVLPLVVLAQLGIVVFVGVLLDTLLVRTVLVPALSLVLGERFWWPRRVTA